jgi:hypothetical protein
VKKKRIKKVKKRVTPGAVHEGAAPYGLQQPAKQAGRRADGAVLRKVTDKIFTERHELLRKLAQ